MTSDFFIRWQPYTFHHTHTHLELVNERGCTSLVNRFTQTEAADPQRQEESVILYSQFDHRVSRTCERWDIKLNGHETVLKKNYFPAENVFIITSNMDFPDFLCCAGL